MPPRSSRNGGSGARAKSVSSPVSAYSVERLLGHALRAGPAPTRGVDPRGVERAVRERLVRGMHPHRAAALRHDPGGEPEVVGVRMRDDEVGDVLDRVARAVEAGDERVPARRIAGGAAVDERDPGPGAREHDDVDVADPRPDERDPDAPQPGPHLEDGDRAGVDRADVGGGADHAIHATRPAQENQSIDLIVSARPRPGGSMTPTQRSLPQLIDLEREGRDRDGRRPGPRLRGREPARRGGCRGRRQRSRRRRRGGQLPRSSSQPDAGRSQRRGTSPAGPAPRRRWQPRSTPTGASTSS